jgi:hypothetical protein
VNPTLPSGTLNTFRNTIIGNSSTYKTNANTYISNNYAVITDAKILALISAKFKVITDIVSLGITDPAVQDPLYNLIGSVSIGASTGAFTCDATNETLVVNQTVTISGTNTGSGVVANGTYYIIATDGNTTFTLSSSQGGSAITTTTGTTTGLNFTYGPQSTSNIYDYARLAILPNLDFITAEAAQLIYNTYPWFN